MIEMYGTNLGTVFQLLTTLFSGGILAAILTFLVKWRALSIGAEQTLRTHFGEELKRLTQQVHDCEKDKRLLWEEIAGLKRQIVERSVDELLILEGHRPSEAAPHAAASAPRVKRILGEGK